jgi:hypothetical protein
VRCFGLVLAQRVGVSLVLALAVAIGVWFSGKFIRESAARVTEIRSQERSATSARAQVAEQRAVLEGGDATFERLLADDAAEFGLAAPTIEMLSAPNAYALELDAPTVLAAGRSWSSPHLRVTAVVEKVMYQQHGASVSASHSIARIENVGATPIAYFVGVSSAERGRCEVRGSRMHNAIALRVGETADVVVCAGGGSIRLDRAEVLELSEFSHRLVSQLPPRALGYDEVTANAHRPLPLVETCAALDAASLVQMMRDGAASWADVVDFYARHDCRRYGFVPGYRRGTTPLPVLPVPTAGAPP